MHFALIKEELWAVKNILLMAKAAFGVEAPIKNPLVIAFV